MAEASSAQVGGRPRSRRESIFSFVPSTAAVVVLATAATFPLPLVFAYKAQKYLYLNERYETIKGRRAKLVAVFWCYGGPTKVNL